MLVESDIEEGKRLLLALDAASLKVSVALWFYFAEDEEWRFVVVAPLIDQKGPKESYAFIQKTLERLAPPSIISLKQISILSSSNNLIKTLRSAVHTGTGVVGIRFSRNMINNTFIEDAYIYRML